MSEERLEADCHDAGRCGDWHVITAVAGRAEKPKVLRNDERTHARWLAVCEEPPLLSCITKEDDI